MNEQNTALDPVDTPEGALTLDEYKAIIDEIENQPRAWRGTADQEMEYAEGNQLKTKLLQAQAALGIPPGMENLIGPALEGIRGYEESTRTDWRVTPNGQPGGQDVADALNFKLNEAERNAKADDACSAAFYPQIAVGLGWVEVCRSSDPFAYPYECNEIHRNEIHFPFDAKLDMSDARWLRRQRWLMPDRLARIFPEHKELIRQFGRAGINWWSSYEDLEYGGGSTGMNRNLEVAREWTRMEDRWYNPINKEVCISELWYRRWVDIMLMKTPEGRIVEFDKDNPVHVYAVANNKARPQRAMVSKVRRSYWLGPHVLFDGPSPYLHRSFPYVPFWGFRENNTKVPFGYVRNMIHQQDTLNSGNSRLRWAIAAYRVVRTEGAVIMDDAAFRRTVGRLDADIVLDHEHMAQPGATFEVERDYQLTAQQMEMLTNARNAIERVNPAAAGAFSGRRGTATSGKQEDIQVEQANQSLAHMMGNHKRGRTQVGELLLSMIVQDIGDSQEEVVIEGDAIRPERRVVLNKPEVDPLTGVPYLSNDLQKMRLKVGLEDVPSTSTFRGQQLNAMSEAIKSLPPQYQAAAMPFLASLMDVPFKRELVEALRAAGAAESPQAIEKRINDAVAEALKMAGHELKARELDIKERKTDAEIELIIKNAVQVGVTTAFTGMQAAGQLAMNPAIAPIADSIVQGSGWQKTPGDDPNFPTPVATPVTDAALSDTAGAAEAAQSQQAQQVGAEGGVEQNTSPAFPPVPQQPSNGQTGIETLTPADNLTTEGAA